MPLLQAVAALCQLLRSGCPLVTLRLDVASREAAETIAQALPDKPTLMHLMMGGNVPEHVLSFIAAALSANTMNKVQAASRSSSLTPPRQRQRSGTPTQLQAHHHRWARQLQPALQRQQPQGAKGPVAQQQLKRSG
jgi:hypothetical protein